MLEALKHINIEPTNACNLNCRFCSDNHTRKAGYMDMALYAKILDQIPKETEVRLFLSGEPLMHSQIDKMISMAAKRGNPTLIHTNGTLMDEDMARRLVYSGLTKISFSIDGTSAREYEEYRGISFKQTQNCVQSFIDNQGRTNVHLRLADSGADSGLTKISFSIDGTSAREYKKYRGVSFKRTQKNVQKFIDLSCGNADTWIQSIIPVKGDAQKAHDFIKKSFSGFYNIYLRRPHNWNVAGSVNGADKLDYEIPCEFLKSFMAIYWDGRVPLCCADLNGDFIIGDLNHESLYDQWLKVDWKLEEQKIEQNIEPCNKCERYGNQQDKA
jgi:sulfatase maturation enzyme AslB (radical SAM superfamily)